jgi:hypothetical protein
MSYGRTHQIDVAAKALTQDEWEQAMRHRTRPLTDDWQSRHLLDTYAPDVAEADLERYLRLRGAA